MANVGQAASLFATQDAAMLAERTPHADDSLLAQPLAALTAWTLCAPRAVLAGAVAVALLATAVTVSGLTFKTSRLDLLNPRSEYNRRWLAYLAEFGNRDDAVVVVRAEQREDLVATIDKLAAKLREEPQYFESVFFRRDLTRLKGKALHYLSPADLTALEQQLAQAAVMLPSPDRGPSPVNELAALNERLSHFGPATPQQRAELEAQYCRAAGMLLASLGLAPAGVRPTQLADPSAGLERLKEFDPQYLLADEGKIGFILLRMVPQAGEAAPDATAITRLRSWAQLMQAQHPRAWIGLTGIPVIEHDEMQASQFDMLWTSIFSMILVLFLYLASYGGLRHAILVNVLLLLATAYSFGFVTIVVGHLNILSAAFSAVLIGLGIDFSIHYVATYLKLRQQGDDEHEALMHMAVEVGPGMVTGGVTTAAAFFMAALTDFIGVRELGLVAGGGILLCVLTTVVVLPPLVLLVDRHWPVVLVPRILPAGRWFQFPLRWPRLVMAFSVLLTVVLGAGAAGLRYDHNLLNLQPRHVESADIERQLFTRLDDSVLYAVSVCRSREELRERKAHFDQLPVVAKTEEIASLVPDHSPRHAQRIAALARQLTALPERMPPAVPVDSASIKQELARAQLLLTREVPFETPAGAMLGKLQAAVAAMPSEELAERMSQTQATTMASAMRGFEALRSLADPVPPRLEDLPRELVDRFVGKNRTYLLKVYARGNIWNMNEMERFVHAVESVDSKVTGHPVQTYYASRHMQQSYLWAGLYALGAVLVLLWADFRSLSHALLAMLPLVFGFVQMCGIIGWLNIPLNPANMIVLPLILGIGVDHGVHLVHVWRQQRGKFSLGDSTAVGVLLTATTTTASFGALILARHQGLQSLGQVLTIGVTTCLGSSIIFFPAVLKWLSPRESEESVAEDLVHEDQRAVNSEVATPEIPDADGPAPATEEEIAALLEVALSPWMLRIAETGEESTTEDVIRPRRRNLPRRTDAA
jgi:hopanoid biosynthesis associated RND transporter like protein HpnN